MPFLVFQAVCIVGFAFQSNLRYWDSLGLCKIIIRYFIFSGSLKCGKLSVISMQLIFMGRVLQSRLFCRPETLLTTTPFRTGGH